MAEKLTPEEFQEFVVEQFGKLAADVSDVRIELRTGLGELRTDIRELRAGVTSINEKLDPLVEAFDRDAQTLVKHDRRIESLEKHAGFTS